MDYQKFIQGLPELYHQWETDKIAPKDPKFQATLDAIEGMTTANIMQLLNWAVGCLEYHEIYCEIGCYQGSTLVGALLDRPQINAYAIDNFSEFDTTGENEEKLAQNLANFNLEKQVVFCNQDFEEFFFDLREVNPSAKIGVYLYDGSHDYRSQLLGLLHVIPFLADRALIVVDDSNWNHVKQANFDFIATHPQASLLLDLRTISDRAKTFWNGLQIFSWDTKTHNSYQWKDFSSQFKNTPAISSIYDLAVEFEFETKPDAIRQLEDYAQQLQANNLLEEAALQFQNLLEWSDSYFPAWLNLGKIYYTQGKNEEALNMINTALFLESSTSEPYFVLGLIQKALGDRESAKIAFQTAIAISPDLVAAREELAKF